MRNVLNGPRLMNAFLEQVLGRDHDIKGNVQPLVKVSTDRLRRPSDPSRSSNE